MSDIAPVTTARQLRRFVDLPYSLYANHPHWVPPLRRDEYRRLSPTHNAFLQHATMDLWLASSGGRTTGRIAAIEDRLHNDTHREAVTWFGFFEADDRRDCAGRSSQRSSGTPASAAARRARAGESVAERERRTADRRLRRGSVRPDAVQPAVVPGFVEAAGYRKVKDLLAWRIDMTRRRLSGSPAWPTAWPAGTASPCGRSTLGAFERDLAIMQGIYRAAWQDNWGFVPPTDAEIRQLAIELQPILDPEMVLFAESGRAAGRVRGGDSRREPGVEADARPAVSVRRAAFPAAPRDHQPGAGAAARRGAGHAPDGSLSAADRRAPSPRPRTGYRRAELSWTLEDNDAVNAGIEAAGGRRHKTYRLYEKPLG